jgi:hypothetical protein
MILDCDFQALISQQQISPRILLKLLSISSAVWLNPEICLDSRADTNANLETIKANKEEVRAIIRFIFTNFFAFQRVKGIGFIF